jgi:hypothetical protein
MGIHENTKRALLGMSNDIIIIPTRQKKIAEYTVYRRDSHVIIIDTKNDFIVMSGDIGHLDPSRNEPLAFGITRVSKGMYIVGIESSVSLLDNASTISPFNKEANSVQNMEQMISIKTARDDNLTGIVKFTGVSHATPFYDRMFLCVGEKYYYLAQYLIKADLLIADICEELNQEKKLKTVWNRICIKTINGARVLEPRQWTVGNYISTGEGPGIICAKNGILVGDVGKVRIVEVTEYVKIDITCNAEVYAYTGKKTFEGNCRLVGDRDDIVRFTNRTYKHEHFEIVYKK